ncbi:carboxylesterase [Apibacter sp. HY039]|uniref:alpha/beta hydrolase n=1 Tax=Apibacter sp. HY039 TaxID=2501476 RepID=UPI000FEB7906|nr:alpha/beta fold hydrolase [Apibacter sp. HY039]
MKNEISPETKSEFLKGNDIGILIIHGFTGSTQSMREVAYQLNRLGYTIQMPRLKGHGTTPEDMETTSYKDWIESVENAYSELKTKVKNLFVLGLSMGGTLTLYCSIHHKIDGAITINAAINLPEFKVLYDDSQSPRFIPGIGSDIKKEGIKEWAYDRTPKKCIQDILTLSNQVREKLSYIKCPLLIFKSKEDHIVPPDNQDYIFSHTGSENKELIELENSYHVATLDNDQELIIQKTHHFIQSILK